MRYKVVDVNGRTLCAFTERVMAEKFMHALFGWDKGWDIVEIYHDL